MYYLTRIFCFAGWIWFVVVGLFWAGYEWCKAARRRELREMQQVLSESTDREPGAQP